MPGRQPAAVAVREHHGDERVLRAQLRQFGGEIEGAAARGPGDGQREWGGQRLGHRIPSDAGFSMD
ncbi:hypothetical protein [Nocardia sp. NPDC051750]|uniref:hypothetical protein n=1 Tax=Nocardia sp. NPDC051750 TaxID=3364325 RepID=UPI00379A479B